MKLEPMKLRDLTEVEAVLRPIVKDRLLRRHLKRHLDKGLCRIMRDDNDTVCGIAMALSDGKRVSLSYYWVREDKRKTFASLWLFIGVFAYFKGRAVYVYSEDISTFESYVEPTQKKNVYRFIGPGKNIDPEKLAALAKERSWAA